MNVQTINTTQKRLRILGDDEIEAIYGIPSFTYEERLEYFSLSPTEKAALEQLHSIKSRIYFILQLGYFKSHHLFSFSILQKLRRTQGTSRNNTLQASNSMILTSPR